MINMGNPLEGICDGRDYTKGGIAIERSAPSIRFDSMMGKVLSPALGPGEVIDVDGRVLWQSLEGIGVPRDNFGDISITIVDEKSPRLIPAQMGVCEYHRDCGKIDITVRHRQAEKTNETLRHELSHAKDYINGWHLQNPVLYSVAGYLGEFVTPMIYATIGSAALHYLEQDELTGAVLGYTVTMATIALGLHVGGYVCDKGERRAREAAKRFKTNPFIVRRQAGWY